MSALFVACKYIGKLCVSADLSEFKSYIIADAFNVSIMTLKQRVDV
jgi:hypothetical protein